VADRIRATASRWRGELRRVPAEAVHLQQDRRERGPQLVRDEAEEARLLRARPVGLLAGEAHRVEGGLELPLPAPELARESLDVLGLVLELLAEQVARAPQRRDVAPLATIRTTAPEAARTGRSDTSRAIRAPGAAIAKSAS